MGKETLPQGEVDALIREFETKLARLRTIYEQYFMGIERQPPTVLRKDVVRVGQRLDNLYIRNTASKFRVRSLVQKFNTYKSYWNRVERQMENGTYVRDIQRARRNQLRRDAAESHQEQHAVEEDAKLDPYSELVAELDLELGESLTELEREFAAYYPGDFTESNSPTVLTKIDVSNDTPPQAPSRRPTPAVSEAALAAESTELSQARNDFLSKPALSTREQKLAKLKTRLTQKVTKNDGPPPAAKQPQKPQAAPVSQPSREPARPAQKPRPMSAQDKLRALQKTRKVKVQPMVTEDPRAKAVFDKLVAAKRKCNESTSGLTYEAVKSSLDKQRQHLKKTRGANDVNFHVVIKNGKAFLKPELK